MRRPTIDTIIKVYEKKAANISATCDALGISRGTFYKWKKDSAKLSEMLSYIDESLIDFAESKLLEKIQDGDTTSIIFFLKTKGKDRGYVETVKNDVTINPFEQIMKCLPDNPD